MRCDPFNLLKSSTILRKGQTAIYDKVSVQKTSRRTPYAAPFSCNGGVRAIHGSPQKLQDVATQSNGEPNRSRIDPAFPGQHLEDGIVDGGSQDLLLDVLDSSATKRDAKAYLSRFKSQPSSLQIPQPPKNETGVNLGNLYLPVRFVEENPVFSQGEIPKQFKDAVSESAHVALVVLRRPEHVNEATLRGIGHTLVQLLRLGMGCVVVIDCEANQDTRDSQATRHAKIQADRLVHAIEESNPNSARRVESIIDRVDSKDQNGSSVQINTSVRIGHRDLLLSPLRRGMVPIIVPIAFDLQTQRRVLVPTDDVVLALTKDLTGLRASMIKEENPHQLAESIKSRNKQVSLDRVIVLDDLGATPSPDRSNGTHVFINLEQEFDNIANQLASGNLEGSGHMRNLALIRNTLSMLPSSSSGLITTPDAVAHSQRAPPATSQGPRVRTRRQRNPLIHNLLTDKPAVSSSLPPIRSPLPQHQHPVSQALPDALASTLVKRGMPVTVIPDPNIHPWTPPSSASSPALSLSDPRLDLPRLVHLIEDSFGRKLDIPHYLSRIENRIAGVIIAGSYEGGALLTWETPSNFPALPSSSSIPSSRSPSPPPSQAAATSNTNPEYIPYLDKFAVLRRSQGAGSVADIVFSTIVRDCFPDGFCWRSRKTNPVNKWYFERAKGTWKLPDMGWTMFWTTEGVDGPASITSSSNSVAAIGNSNTNPAVSSYRENPSPQFANDSEHLLQMEKSRDESLFEAYERVCRGVVPSWGDGKQVLD